MPSHYQTGSGEDNHQAEPTFFVGDSPEATGDVTVLLRRAARGDNDARHEVVPLLYEELRLLARAVRSRQGGGETLNTTALVHEAYVRIARGPELRGSERAAFFALAASVMRSVVVDHARSGNAAKRGGGWSRQMLDDVVRAVDTAGYDLEALNAALDRLANLDQRKAAVVDLRFFAGMTNEQAAEALGVSVPTVERDWRTARAWLHAELADNASNEVREDER